MTSDQKISRTTWSSVGASRLLNLSSTTIDTANRHKLPRHMILMPKMSQTVALCTPLRCYPFCHVLHCTVAATAAGLTLGTNTSCTGMCVYCVCVSNRVPLCFRDSVIYSANCSKLKDQMVAIKMYNKAKLSPSKMRAIKREAAMMIYMTRKRCGCTAMTYAALHTVAL